MVSAAAGKEEAGNGGGNATGMGTVSRLPTGLCCACLCMPECVPLCVWAHFERMCFAFLHLIAPLCSKLNCCLRRGCEGDEATKSATATATATFGRQHWAEQQQCPKNAGTYGTHTHTQPENTPTFSIVFQFLVSFR